MSQPVDCTKPSKPVRCAIYKRCATLLQGEDALAEQEAVCRELATDRGWQVLDEHVYGDVCASGNYIYGRPRLAALLEAASKRPRPFDRLLVEGSSRLSRCLPDLLKIVDTLQACGVQVQLVVEGVATSDLDSFRLFFVCSAMISEQMRNALSRRVRTSQH